MIAGEWWIFIHGPLEIDICTRGRLKDTPAHYAEQSKTPIWITALCIFNPFSSTLSTPPPSALSFRCFHTVKEKYVHYCGFGMLHLDLEGNVAALQGSIMRAQGSAREYTGNSLFHNIVT